MELLIPLTEGLVAAAILAALADSLAQRQAPQEELIPIPVEKQQR